MGVIVVIVNPVGAAISLLVPTYKCPVLRMMVAMLTMLLLQLKRLHPYLLSCHLQMLHF
ncbi:MAG TPA: hypothetical protein VE843_02445 [Ktedonobacteraceae bacterium]|nr:hypothetical protein [Ktedonobacteraceae bacterium]